MTRTLWLSLAVVFALLCNCPLWAQTTLTSPFSPQAIGRAGIYTSAETDDPLAALSNPALLGFQAERNRFMASFFPAHASWKTYGPQIGYTARSLQIGFDQKFLQRYFHWKTPLSFGIGYEEAYFDLGETHHYDENAHDLGYFESYERSQGVDLAAALHYRYLQAGLGLSYRFTALRYMAPVSDHAVSSDIGLYLQSPLDRLVNKHPAVGDGNSTKFRPVCTAAFGYVLANAGPTYQIHSSGSQSSTVRVALPRTAKMGLNLATAIRASRSPQDSLNLISFDMGIEAQDDLVKHWTSPEYQNPIGNIHPISTLLFGKSESGVVIRKGFEVGVIEAIYYRWGNVTGAQDSDWPWHDTTDGFGMRLGGILKLTTWAADAPHGKVIDLITRHFDLQYDQSTIHQENSLTDGITYKQFSLLWKY